MQTLYLWAHELYSAATSRLLLPPAPPRVSLLIKHRTCMKLGGYETCLRVAQGVAENKSLAS